MSEEITELIGKEEGPTSIILAGIHGNEQCGVEALKKILPSLKIEKGNVLFGYGNPRAIEANKRYTETNLNRMFKNNELLSKKEKESYEYQRAQFLKTYLGKAEALLDIHASSTPNSKVFAICEANAKGIIEYLPVDLVVSGFDDVQPGGTDYYMNSIGKVGICVECGYLGSPESIKTAEESIFAFLKARGHLSNDIAAKRQSHVRMYDLYFTRTDNFTLSKPFADFEEIKKGQVVGTDGGEEVKTGKNSVILFARNRGRVGDEAFLLGEKCGSGF
ncbi:MAG: succinylglutamate desuccinylase/aspartoacylase family protein [Patescibacteria group bacterium]|nr:succinylglutamate desuccinylase/aspartoacylase family protein [Patescibacteria group bacterium]